jgi:methionyl-tRNA formyltransferase
VSRTKSRTVIIGKGDIAVNCLEYLASIDELPVLVVYDKDDSGIDNTVSKSLLRRALNLGYVEGQTVITGAKPNSPEFIEFLQSFKPDIIFSLQPRTIFHQPFINSAKLAVINLHFAPLPKLRGVAPCSWAIVDGLSSMGVTMHLITRQGVDVDPILFQKLFPIESTDTAWSLFQKCINYGTKLFQSQYDDFTKGVFKPIAQNETEATYHPMGEFRFDSLIPDLQQNAVTVDRFIRSRIFPPLQLPYVIHQGKKLWITSSSLMKPDSGAERPAIIVNKNNVATLYCRQGTVRVTVVKNYSPEKSKSRLPEPSSTAVR